jgi:hypothetical protein
MKMMPFNRPLIYIATGVFGSSLAGAIQPT